MRKLLASAAAGLLSVSLVACGAESGTVTSKRFEPGGYRHTQGQPTYTTQCTTAGYPPTTSCQQIQTGYSSNLVYEPACFRVAFEDEEGKKGRACVSAPVYHRLEVGDHYEPASR